MVNAVTWNSHAVSKSQNFDNCIGCFKMMFGKGENPRKIIYFLPTVKKCDMHLLTFEVM
jgi:Ni,Fe-hydrogenase I small subunit